MGLGTDNFIIFIEGAYWDGGGISQQI